MTAMRYELKPLSSPALKLSAEMLRDDRYSIFEPGDSLAEMQGKLDRMFGRGSFTISVIGEGEP